MHGQKQDKAFSLMIMPISLMVSILKVDHKTFTVDTLLYRICGYNSPSLRCFMCKGDWEVEVLEK